MGEEFSPVSLRPRHLPRQGCVNTTGNARLANRLLPPSVGSECTFSQCHNLFFPFSLSFLQGPSWGPPSLQGASSHSVCFAVIGSLSPHPATGISGDHRYCLVSSQTRWLFLNFVYVCGGVGGGGGGTGDFLEEPHLLSH